MRRTLARSLAAAPAICGLALAPAAEAHPLWVSICTGKESKLAALPKGPFEKPEEERQRSLCAHATSPREFRLDRRGRRNG